MSAKNLVARIGQIATRGKHKDRFLFVGVCEPRSSLEKIFYLIEIDSPWVNGEKIKNIIVNTLDESWRSADRKDRIDTFEETIKKINLGLGDLAHSGEHEWIGKLNAIIGLSAGNQLIFSQTGKISGYLFRGNKISHITEKPLETEEAHPLKTFISIINGSVALKDKAIVGNAGLYTHLSLDRLRQILSTYSYKDAIAEITKTLRRSRIKDVNLMVFDFVGEDEVTTPDDDKPDIILLDDIPDSKPLHYTKVFFKGAAKGAKATGKGIKIFGKFWMRVVQPKISGKARAVSGRVKDLSTRALKPVSEKLGTVPRVNYFTKKPGRGAGGLIGLKRFFGNLVLWSGQLLKPGNRKYLYITLIVLLLAIGFLKIQMNNRQNTSLKTQNESLASLDSARDLYAKALDDLGLKLEGGKEKLIQAQDAANNAAESPAIRDEAKNLLTQIQAKLDELNNTIRISAGKEPTFSLPGENLKIYAVGADLYVFNSVGEISKFDTRKKTLISVTSIGKDNGTIKNLAFSDTLDNFFCYTDKAKVIKIDLGSGTISDEAITDQNGNWENAVGIATFSTNIYLLDANAGEIWKHSKNDNGYSKGISYLTKPTIPIKEAVDMSIDGDIYVLKGDGSVVRVKKAVEDTSFGVNKPPTPDDKISSPVKIYVSVDSNSIYILDKGANRVLEFSKTGAYKKQYVADSELPITDFAVNAKIKKFWLLAGTKVFELDI